MDSMGVLGIKLDSPPHPPCRGWMTPMIDGWMTAIDDVKIMKFHTIADRLRPGTPAVDAVILSFSPLVCHTDGTVPCRCRDPRAVRVVFGHWLSLHWNSSNGTAQA